MHSILENPARRIPISSATTDQILSLINGSNDNPNKEKIQHLRTTTGKEYDRLKRKLVCFTPNAFFLKYVDSLSITSTTGYIYVDLDDDDGFNYEKEMNALKVNPNVYAAWDSVSGKGIGSLLKVDWVTQQNFEYVYSSAVKSLVEHGTSQEYIDPRCRDITRLNYLSLSENVYTNPDAKSLIEPEESIVSSVISLSLCNASNDTLLKVPVSLQRIKYKTDLEDWGDDENFRFIPEGKDYVRIYIGNGSYSKGERNYALFRVGCMIMKLNPHLKKDELSAHLWSVNQRMCIEPLAPLEVNGIALSIINIAHRNGLFAHSIKKKIWFKPGCPYTSHEKQSISAQLMANEKVRKTLLSFENAIMELQSNCEKITQKKLALKTGKSIATVKRHWQEVKKLME